MSSSRRSHSALRLRANWLAAQVVGTISPRLARRFLWRLWFTPFSIPQSPSARERERGWLAGTEEVILPWAEGRVRCVVRGAGPTVLLIHGWGGWSGSMGAMIGPLAERGFRVVAVDLPAHGGSPGDLTNPFEIRKAVVAVAGQEGPIHALISHSMGGMAAMLALENGVRAQKLVLLSPALRVEPARDRFAELAKLRPRVMRQLVTSIERRYGSHVWDDLNGLRIAAGLERGRVPDTLILHDPRDRDAPIADSEALAGVLPRATLVPMEGAGHHRILLSAEAIDQCLLIDRRGCLEHQVGDEAVELQRHEGCTFL